MRPHPLPLAIVVLFCSASAHAGSDRLIMSTGLDYTSGKYGSQTRTETWVIPLSLKYRTDDWYVRAATSFQHMLGDGNVTADGDPLGGSGNSTSVSGMGDLMLGAAYTLFDDATRPVGLDIGGKIKFGTASTSKSLGTGEDDYALFAEIYKSLGRWAPYLNLGYKWKCDPDGIEYRNVWFGSVGTQYRMTSTLSAGGSYDWQQAVTASGARVSEAVLFLNIKVNTENRMNLYVVGGFSEGSPDWGSGVMYSHLF